MYRTMNRLSNQSGEVAGAWKSALLPDSAYPQLGWLRKNNQRSMKSHHCHTLLLRSRRFDRPYGSAQVNWFITPPRSTRCFDIAHAALNRGLIQCMVPVWGCTSSRSRCRCEARNISAGAREGAPVMIRGERSVVGRRIWVSFIEVLSNSSGQPLLLKGQDHWRPSVWSVLRVYLGRASTDYTWSSS